MTYRLECTLSHKSFGEPLHKEYYYTGDTLDHIVDQIETLDCHKYNLKKHKQTAFKSTDGVKHLWKLTLMPDLN